MARMELFFDCGSPWTYLAFHRIEAVASRAGAELVWKPILVGGVFNAVNDTVYAQRATPNPRKAHYHAKDLQDWARLYGLEIGWPTVFPVNSVKAMRGAVVAQATGDLLLALLGPGGMSDDRGESALAETGNIAVSAAAGALGHLAGGVVVPSVPRIARSVEELVAGGVAGGPPADTALVMKLRIGDDEESIRLPFFWLNAS